MKRVAPTRPPRLAVVFLGTACVVAASPRLSPLGSVPVVARRRRLGRQRRCLRGAGGNRYDRLRFGVGTITGRFADKPISRSFNCRLVISRRKLFNFRWNYKITLSVILRSLQSAKITNARHALWFFGNRIIRLTLVVYRPTSRRLNQHVTHLSKATHIVSNSM